MIAATAIHTALQQWVVACTGLAPDRVVWGRQNKPALAGAYIALDLTLDAAQGSDWLVYSANTVTFAPLNVTAAANICTGSAHGFTTGDGPVLIDGSDPRWIIVLSPTTFQCATTHALAVAVVPTVAAITNGARTITADPTFARQGAEGLTTARGVRSVTLKVECFTPSPIDDDGGFGVLSRLAGSQALPGKTAILDAANLSARDFGAVVVVGPTINTVKIDARASTTITFNATSFATETHTTIESVEVSSAVLGVNLTVSAL